MTHRRTLVLACLTLVGAAGFTGPAAWGVPTAASRAVMAPPSGFVEMSHAASAMATTVDAPPVPPARMAPAPAWTQAAAGSPGEFRPLPAEVRAATGLVVLPAAGVPPSMAPARTPVELPQHAVVYVPVPAAPGVFRPLTKGPSPEVHMPAQGRAHGAVGAGRARNTQPSARVTGSASAPGPFRTR